MNKYKYKEHIAEITGYSDFACTGELCDDSCCHTWTISITEDIYSKLISVDNEIKEELKENISEPNEKGLRKFILDEEQWCKFLTPSGLCKIQRYFGVEYLPHICRTYPRFRTRLNKTVIDFNMLSCSEAVKHTLLNNRKVEIKNKKAVFTVQEGDFEPIEAVYEKIRDFYLDILHADVANLWQKIAIMSLATEKFNTVCQQEDVTPKDINEITKSYLLYVNDTQIFEKLAKAKFKSTNERYSLFAAAWLILRAISIDSKANTVKNKKMHEIIKSIEENCKNEDWNMKIVNSIFSFLEKYIKENEYIFVNLLSYLVVTQLFSEAKTKPDLTVKTRFLKIIIMTLMIQMFIAAVHAEMGKFDEHSLRNIIALWFRQFHSETNIERVLNFCKEIQSISPSEIIIAFMYE